MPALPPTPRQGLRPPSPKKPDALDEIMQAMQGRQGKKAGGLGDEMVLLHDYKRRHTSQNKEIIRENARHKLEKLELLDERDKLRQQVIDLAKENAELKAKLKRLEGTVGALGDRRVTTALAHLNEAMPALQHLHQQLSLLSLMPSSVDSLARTVQRPQITEWAERPVVAALGETRLDHVTEASESEDAFSTGLAARRRNRRSTSAEASRRSTSPRLHETLATEPASYRSTTSSSSDSAEHDGTYRPSRFVDQEHKSIAAPAPRPARRQSGLFRPASMSPPVQEQAGAGSSLASVMQAEIEAARASGTTSPKKRRRQSELDAGRVEAATGVQVLKAKAAGLERGVAGSSSAERARSQPVNTATAQAVLPPTVIAPPAAPDLPVESTVEDPNADGRQRRARKSVNYREPSLHTKMRKPDGAPASLNEAYVARPLEPSSSATPGARSRSTTPSHRPTDISPMVLSNKTAANTAPTGFLDDPCLEVIAAAKASSKMVDIGRAEEPAVASSMRRKSVLPRTARPAVSPPVPNATAIRDEASLGVASAMRTESRPSAAAARSAGTTGQLEDGDPPAAESAGSTAVSTSANRKVRRRSSMFGAAE